MPGILLNILLFLLKFAVGRLGGSVSVTADAFNNLTDAGTALLTLLGLSAASCGGGEKHEHGHGRFEWITALIASCSVILVGWELLKTSVNTLISPEPLVFHGYMVLALACSVAVKLFLAAYYTGKGQAQDVQSYKAAAADSLSDAVSTGAVLLSLILYGLFQINLDGYCGAAVSVFIIFNGFRSFWDTADRIIGTHGDAGDLSQVVSFIEESEPGIFAEAYDLQIEDYGCGNRGLSATLAVSPGVTADQAVEAAARLRSEFYLRSGCIPVIQLELPKSARDSSLIEAQIRDFLRAMPYETELRQIRVNRSGPVTQVVLLLEIPFELRSHEGEIRDTLTGSRVLRSDAYAIIVKILVGKSKRWKKDSR